MRIFQKGFHFGQDGPGNRLVYHLQGCNMHCIWCSNPEGMEVGGGMEYDAETLLNECVRSRPMFFSGGGVTFTGGEVLMQYESLLLLLKELKKADIHTAIETNGTFPQLQEVLPYVDYLIMDFKHYDSESLKRFTGVGAEGTKENFEANCKNGRQQHIRIPLIHNVNDANPEGFASYFSQFDTENTVFEFLPYHEYGKGKWTKPYMVENGFVTNETVQHFKTVFENHHLKIITT